MSKIPKDIPLDILDEVMYNPESPSCLSWKVHRKNRRKDLIAGCKDSRGYWKITIDYKVYLVHRIIWLIHKGSISKELVINHIDNNPSNNLIENLEQCTQAENCRRKGLHKLDQTGLRFHSINDCEYWRAQYTDLQGKIYFKYFSITRFGFSKALQDAIFWRDMMIIKLNDQGAGYTMDKENNVKSFLKT